MRVGIGYDSHRFDPARHLVLGGVAIPDHAGLEGHSDGDAVAHALIDALLGAASIGDVGELFPDSDPRWRGADSMELLALAVEALKERRYGVVNVDVTVVAESPRISEWKDRMREVVGERLGIPVARVSIKGKTNEGMGWIGRGEGIAVIAVGLVERTGVVRRPSPEPSED